MVYLAVTGSASGWLVVVGAFALGLGLSLVLLRFETQRHANGTALVWIGLAAGAAGVLIDSAAAVVQLGVVAAANGYLVGLAVVARRRAAS
jgi:hypothetical protein